MNILYLLYLTLAVFSKQYDISEDTEVTFQSQEDLQLRLVSNPTTGYSWTVQLSDNSQLEPNSPQGEFIIQETRKGMVGSPGHQLFVFKCKASCSAGTETAVFSYARPWEKTAIETIRVKIQIVLSSESEL